MKNYETILQIRISKKEREAIHEYCKNNNTNVSKLLRDYMNSLVTGGK